MVSSPHEAMHRIFQEYPELFPRVSEMLGVPFPTPTSATVLPTDLTESRPVERRVDTLLRFDTEKDGAFLLAVEAQGKKDPAKPASWAYYLSYLHTKYQLPPVLLVVCQDRATADWAARHVHIGPSQELSLPLAELIAQGLGKRPVAQLWRQLMANDLSFYTSPVSEELRDQGRLEGRTEGRAEQAAKNVLLLLQRRAIPVSDEVRARITGCGDLELLERWLLRTLTATTADDIFTDE
ncbi:hypothetical protein [Streptomyces sp. NPDC000229]|uniref:hypothetical protein n=1 Tax=Streptomyces sp. NPDC000229 TaxID=3154247 RepID=UPI0033188CC4